jgi:hypothetical protein
MSAIAGERTAREIAKTRASIRRKYAALRAGKMESEIALEKRYEPIVKPLKRLVDDAERRGEERDNFGDDGGRFTLAKKLKTTTKTRKDSENGDDDDDDDAGADLERDYEEEDDVFTPIRTTTTARKGESRPARLSSAPATSSTPIHGDSVRFLPREREIVSETASPPPALETSVRQSLSTAEGRDVLHSQLGPLGREYVGALLSGDRKKEIDHVYGVYLGENGTMLGDKRFDVAADDSVIVDGTRFKGTRGLYELIFMRTPDAGTYTNKDKLTYRTILFSTNAHKRGRTAGKPIMGNKGYKYRNIIAPLVLPPSHKVGTTKGAGLPSAMRLTDNAIDYVHWDDPNELVDRLRLLDASRRAGNDAHGNEILSIIEELREAGFVIN